ncbi:uncharacterized protein LOC115959285 [Quercus lobata]|uniref:uncharacterized protein LOC115959285 n=1 Tax=Quercus lobata TaxID=97700 RepID=UPI001246A70E|nr:uncharacterized protein LOC115959285 [Quercus lobata]
MCPSAAGYPDFYAEQANALNNYGKPFASPFSETYNPNWRNHPNFSWRQSQPPTNVGGQQVHQQSQFRPPTQAYPPIPQSTPQFVTPPRQQPSLEESLKTFMQSTSQAIQEMKSSTHLNTQAISKLENQVGQLATQVGEREKGKFPSQPIPNPKGQYAINGSSSSTHGQEHVQSITTLRSGKQVDNQVKMPEVEDDENIMLKEKGTHSSHDDHREKKDNPPATPIQDLNSPLDKRFVPKASFPQRLISPQKSAQFGDILEVFKQVQINIPFLDAIQQVPAYAKFLKDLVTMKRKTNVPKKAFLTEQVSSIIQNKYPVKCKDPGSPTISCRIGDHLIERALLDLGASVNLLPYSVYLQLGLGDLKPTTMTLQLADRSVKIPRGRPFLATSNALINCRSGVMKISFGNMTVELNIFDISKQVLDNEDICEVNMIGSLVHDTFLQSSCEDPPNACLTRFDCNLDTEKSIEEVNALLDSIPLLSIDSWQPKVIPLPLSSSLFPSIVEPPKLGEFWEHQLISILQEYKEAIGWKIADIKGISASVVMQRIHLEDTAKASQHVFDPGLFRAKFREAEAEAEAEASAKAEG